ncbi:MAG: nucleotidyltransferase domain-containing protein [Pseudomonadota bacterium]
MAKFLEELQQKREKIYAIAEKYGISNIRVFGSVARGEETIQSDVDLLVSISKHKGMGFDLIRFEREFSEEFHKKTDVISENGIHNSLKEKIFNEAIAL